MTSYVPYHPPVIASRGWRVGPTEYRVTPAEGGGDGVEATLTVDVVVDMELAAGTGEGLDAEFSYEILPVWIDMLPAVSTGAGVDFDPSVVLSETADLATGAGDALAPTLTVEYTFSYTDTFNRADSGSLGSDWTDRIGGFSIYSNAARSETNNDFDFASYNTAASTDDAQASITLGALQGSGYDAAMVFLGANTSGEGAYLWKYGANAILYTTTTWANARYGGTTRASNATGFSTATSGSVITLKRVGNVYTALLDGSPVSSMSWTDSGSALTRDSNHRLAGIGGYYNSGTVHYRLINSFTLENV